MNNEFTITKISLSDNNILFVTVEAKYTHFKSVSASKITEYLKELGYYSDIWELFDVDISMYPTLNEVGILFSIIVDENITFPSDGINSGLCQK